MNKIIFLDIDGVLNPFAKHQRLGFADSEEYNRIRQDLFQVGIDDPFAPFISKENVAWLNGLVLESGAYIVISSTWRILNSLVEIRTILAYFGFLFGKRIFDTTPKKVSPSRSHEIQLWLDSNKVDKFVVLDDENVQGFPNNLVQTDPAKGFVREDLEKALAILEG